MSAPIEEREIASEPRLEFDHIRSDIEALAAMERGSAAEDKPQVAWLERRLRDAGAHELQTEPFRFQRHWIWRHAAHTAKATAAAAIGGPLGAGLAAATLASYELELSGKSHWTGRFLPAGEGTNVVARIPAAGPAERTLVFAAHHDTQRAGWLWRSPLIRAAFKDARKRKGPRPLGTGAELLIVLVVSLDTLGAGEPAVVTKESALLATYPPDDLGWADRGALRAAVAPPLRTSMTATTDAIIARHAGFRAISLVSVDEAGTLGPHYHQPTDTPENVDYQSVEQCTRLAAGIALVWDAAG